MKIIDGTHHIISPEMGARARHEILTTIEAAGRTCYKSEGAITDSSAADFVRKLRTMHHEAMLEHASISVRFVTDRAIANEMVRHRIASYAQESTRYCNYAADRLGGELVFVRPFTFEPGSWESDIWESQCHAAEDAYLRMIRSGIKPEWARSVLPLSTKTEIVVTMNLREWRHFFRLRVLGETGPAHPQIVRLCRPLLLELQQWLPEVFDDLEPN